MAWRPLFGCVVASRFWQEGTHIVYFPEVHIVYFPDVHVCSRLHLLSVDSFDAAKHWAMIQHTLKYNCAGFWCSALTKYRLAVAEDSFVCPQWMRGESVACLAVKGARIDAAQ